MTIVIDESYLPATLTAAPMTDEEFASFCAQYPNHMIEMTAEGEILIMPPNYSLSGVRNSRIQFQLERWSIADGRGVVTDSSSGFVLPNGARRSPDAAWTSRVRLEGMEPQYLGGFWHLAPDFVIELKSQADRLPVLRRKMQEWIENGSQLAWLIDPERRAVEIFRANREPEILEPVESVAGEGLLEGLTLDLRPIWEPL